MKIWLWLEQDQQWECIAPDVKSNYVNWVTMQIQNQNPNMHVEYTYGDKCPAAPLKLRF